MRVGRVAVVAVAFLLMSACVALISACSPMVDSRGNLPDDDAVLQVQPGIDDRSQVAKLLGSPSTIATFNDKTWYYISKKTSRVAPVSPSSLINWPNAGRPFAASLPETPLSTYVLISAQPWAAQ